MYTIDYHEKPWYGDTFHNSDMEFAIDKLLSYLSYICYLKKTRNISNEEFKALEYEIVRACSSYDVQAYLWNLYHFSKACNAKCSFDYLITFGLENGLIPDSFKSDKCDEYEQRLGF